MSTELRLMPTETRVLAEKLTPLAGHKDTGTNARWVGWSTISLRILRALPTRAHACRNVRMLGTFALRIPRKHNADDAIATASRENVDLIKQSNKLISFIEHSLMSDKLIGFSQKVLRIPNGCKRFRN